jgi:hypothetical protein
LRFLEQDQQAEGHFPALRRFLPGVPPHGEPSALPGWYAFGKCPFVAASVAYHLRHVEHEAAVRVKKRACEFLLGTFEHGLVRYVPKRYQPVWFPMDVDDTCMVRVVLRDNGHAIPTNDQELLDNRHAGGGFYTWFVPRIRHLRTPAHWCRTSRDFVAWSRKLLRQNRRNGWRLVKEYWTTREPSVDANVRIYFGRDPRIADLDAAILAAVRSTSVRLEYYDSMMVLYFHLARAVERGATPLAAIADEAHQYIAAREASQGGSRTMLEIAMSALTLMYLGLWKSQHLDPAIECLLRAEPEALCMPEPYTNPVNREFTEGAGALTAAICLDALDRYARGPGRPA